MIPTGAADFELVVVTNLLNVAMDWVRMLQAQARRTARSGKAARC